ncbi:unnamed protein product [Linum trigynum]|uniref:Reverse transcriptase zinc-binding domain-containing protein n=1 Tax=Linum trigynum TaxID=586398 RepID=A0AAV2CN75_9ROSI
MDGFYKLSGLKCNASKCQLYCAGISQGEKQAISAFTEFPLGEVLVKYLGVQLISGKLKRSDCQVLIAKITQRLRSWRSRLLSYAGKIQLISTVIRNTLQYWLNIFLLPQYIIKEVERLCNEFLWDSAENGTRKRAVMAWDKVALPRKEGGLGIRNFSLWNKACMLRHIWNILISGGSLWVAWVIIYRLKQKTIWEIPASSASNWIWKRFLKCRNLAFPFISGNGPHVLCEGEKMQKYSVTRVWNAIRIHEQEVPWWKLVWAKEVIPKHGFILWLALRDKLVLNKISYRTIFGPRV